MGLAGVCPSAVRVSAMRYASLASNAGKFGIGESLVKTTTEPTARTAVHGQFALHECSAPSPRQTTFSGEPS